MIQHQLQVAGSFDELHVATVGHDRATLAAIAEVVDHDFMQAALRLVDAACAQKQSARHDVVDHLFAQCESRLGAADVRRQDAQPMIGGRQHVIVEVHHGDREHRCAAEHGAQDAAHRHTTCLERRDFAFGRESAERVQHRDKHSHGQCHRDRERNGEPEEFCDHRRRQPLADEIAEAFCDEIQQQERRQCRERKSERTEMLTEDVAAEDLHGGGSGRYSAFRSSRIFDGPEPTRKPNCDTRLSVGFPRRRPENGPAPSGSPFPHRCLRHTCSTVALFFAYACSRSPGWSRAAAKSLQPLPVWARTRSRRGLRQRSTVQHR